MADCDFGIIGGGACGIGCGKFLSSSGYSFEIIEKKDDFGGLWYFGTEHGLVYASTHLISSKTNTQFSDFPMPADYPHYPNHKLFLKYLRSIAKHYGLYEHTKFNATVLSAKPLGDEWCLELDNGDKRTYKYLLVCNGRLNKPIIPDIPGAFTGEVLHAADYTTPDLFINKSVLIIGSGNTGCDLAVDAVQNASRVLHSTRRGYHYMPKFIDGKPTQDWLMQIGSQFESEQALWDYVQKSFKFAGYDGVDYGLLKPDHAINQAHPIINSLVLYHIGHGNIIPKADVKEYLNNIVSFADGSQEQIDLIIYATGYEIDFPFLDPQDVDIKDDLSNAFLYEFDKKFDNLFYIGFLNSPSGLGNLANTSGNLLMAYIKAKEKNNDAYKQFLKIKQGDNPDLGQHRFVSTKRHAFEVDLWKYIKTLNFLTAKLSEDK
jgi:cation diffusion facilitator CzcD-associated flavoprotein CzcO